jgi:hypothetical protein
MKHKKDHHLKMQIFGDSKEFFSSLKTWYSGKSQKTSFFSNVCHSFPDSGCAQPS